MYKMNEIKLEKSKAYIKAVLFPVYQLFVIIRSYIRQVCSFLNLHILV